MGCLNICYAPLSLELSSLISFFCFCIRSNKF
ncbi:hypothetical protein G5S_0621 [Chlamydia pecorum E58]|uniref:Uncharacterized protein n=1 Tax=Chlamydia pecorum (strain ATCC VR-628 / DSM 29919 / E58) TaxID=331635 RepID=A0AA34RD98_CHLPE|nr:hypothetical protein G5S_0621 [Chlamydia pecorum E58]ETF37767.1 hypothetical protein CpecS_0546 [Chlamydia pecorum VR629]ETF37857.1 hypothetical protein CpecF_0541 [Chlamydia pecorum DBDeUG]